MKTKDYIVIVLCFFLMLYGFYQMRPPAPLPDAADASYVEDDLGGGPLPTPPDGAGSDTATDPGTTATAEPPADALPAAGAFLPRFTDSAAASFDAVMPTDWRTFDWGVLDYALAPGSGGLATIDLPAFELDKPLGHADLPTLAIDDDSETWRFSPALITPKGGKDFDVERQVAGKPLVIRQEWRFDEAAYRMRCRLVLHNLGTEPLHLPGLRVRAGVLPDLGTPQGFMGAGGIDQRVDIRFADDEDPKTYPLAKLAKLDMEDARELRQRPTAWIAVQNKYFATILSGDRDFAGVTAKPAPELAVTLFANPREANSYQCVVRRFDADLSAPLSVELAVADDVAVQAPPTVRFGSLASAVTFSVKTGGEATAAETALTVRAPGYIGGRTTFAEALPLGAKLPAHASSLVGYLHLPVTLEGGASEAFQLDLFAGPKQYALLKDLGDNKKSLMQFDLFLFMRLGWFEYISRAILWGLITFESFFGNYGIAILLVTLIFRLLFWPITHKSTIMSRKMQAIQPLAKELRQKYKNDPQKLHQKTMELYREHKINPISGCLPALLQIPAFFALFNVLRNAIELRHAGFLWATDLSLPDTIGHLPLIGLPINPLAFLMGASMILQMKIVPTSADPSQQKMMMIMSGMFIIFLYTMPSGLTLYWTANQILNIVQYRITHKMFDKEAAAKVAAS